MNRTAKEMADKLTGREYGSEISKAEALVAKQAGLCVVFGASDDLVEFRGAFHEECDAYDGGAIPIHPERGPLQDHVCDCEYCGYKDSSKDCHILHADWCKVDGYSWTFRIDIPHESFEIVEDGEPYCRGIVFKVADLLK